MWLELLLMLEGKEIPLFPFSSFLEIRRQRTTRRKWPRTPQVLKFRYISGTVVSKLSVLHNFSYGFFSTVGCWKETNMGKEPYQWSILLHLFFSIHMHQSWHGWSRPRIHLFESLRSLIPSQLLLCAAGLLAPCLPQPPLHIFAEVLCSLGGGLSFLHETLWVGWMGIVA